MARLRKWILYIAHFRVQPSSIRWPHWLSTQGYPDSFFLTGVPFVNSKPHVSRYASHTILVPDIFQTLSVSTPDGHFIRPYLSRTIRYRILLPNRSKIVKSSLTKITAFGLTEYLPMDVSSGLCPNDYIESTKNIVPERMEPLWGPRDDPYRSGSPWGSFERRKLALKCPPRPQTTGRLGCELQGPSNHCPSCFIAVGVLLLPTLPF